MIDAYVTAAESQVHLAVYADWLALTDAEQDTHLSWGRVWIDTEFVCAYDETDATEDIKHANSLAGYANFSGTLYTDLPTIKSTAVGAGPVSSSKTYAGGYKKKDVILKQAAALLGFDCSKSGASNTTGLCRN